MKILIAFIVAFVIGAASRWTGVPSLAPQAIIGALLIVAMSTGYVSVDHLLKRTSARSIAASASTGATTELGAHGREVISHESPAIPEPEADTAFWRQRSEALQLIIADLLLTNQQLRSSETFMSPKTTTHFTDFIS
ncbi:XapX domain-containing protein [Granulicella mallensis]|jgi:XapX domain-containing protein|uniref:XapX domain-containing protein n=1 Tax=Granulicella mallensis TaxID=940614 RepID=A0A7W7ZLQ2_9BACT|nr:XapX domain-containing protein [Granulicella mallensis]MBB5061844.1 XapX domain-containing protein [Granulicella mallensis]